MIQRQKKATRKQKVELIDISNQKIVTITVPENTTVKVINDTSIDQDLKINVLRGAKLSVYGTHQKGIITKSATVAQDGAIAWIDVIGGDAVVSTKTDLQEKGAEVNMAAACKAIGAELPHLNQEVFHKAPHTNSSLQVRGVLYDKAKAECNSIIRIEKNASQCHGKQRTDILLIGEEARCDAVPILDVENDTVTCSHGMSISQVNPEHLFYLSARGLAEKEALALIASGFLQPILDLVSK